MSHSQGVGRYRKLPIEIEAVQLSWRNWSDVCEFLGEIEPQPWQIPASEASDMCGEFSPNYIALKVITVHGEEVVVRHGDWIIPDSKPGTFYPCKPDVFAATYEPAPDQDRLREQATQLCGSCQHPDGAHAGGACEQDFCSCPRMRS